MTRAVLPLLLAVVALCVAAQTAQGCSVFNPFGCAARKMWEQYRAMRSSNCRNCDKYFHCKGNYNAVYSCSGNRSANRRTAETISDCREWAQGSSSADSRADQVANRFGRNGGNCEARYLCNVQCAWSPRTRTCRSSNCP